jgi:ABC-2 type transport system permease protein
MTAHSMPAPPRPGEIVRVSSPGSRWVNGLRGMWILTWRQKLAWRQIPGVVVTLVTLPVLLFLTLTAGLGEEYFCNFIGYTLQLILPFFCLTLFGDLVREDLQANTLVFLTTRPLSRAQIYLFKFCGVWLWAELIMGLHVVLLAGVGWARQVDGALPLLALAAATQFLAILVFGALSALLGLLQRRFLVLGLLYGLVVEVGIGQIPTNINTLSMVRHIKSIMGHNATAHDVLGWMPDSILSATAAMLVATAVFLALGALVFTYREFHKNEGMEK